MDGKTSHMVNLGTILPKEREQGTINLLLFFDIKEATDHSCLEN